MTSTTVRTPAVAATRAELAALLAERRGEVVLVPTMGALHEGHAGLVRLARERAGADGVVVVSVFVNPLQFGAGEDLDRYPRTFDADLETCGDAGADVVFAPAVDEVYPGGVPEPEVSKATSFGPAGARTSTTGAVTVDPGSLAEILEGETRPGHFRGVLTVVAKLFGLVRPDAAVFGEKDYQQLVLIRRMVADLCFSGTHGPLQVIGAPTAREDDGLARSSRNRYLDDEERYRAAALSRVLQAARAEASYGVAAALRAGRAELRAAHGVDLDYFEIRAEDLSELPDDPDQVPPGTSARALIAARVGTTRLIDNLALTVGAHEGEDD